MIYCCYKYHLQNILMKCCTIGLSKFSTLTKGWRMPDSSSCNYCFCWFVSHFSFIFCQVILPRSWKLFAWKFVRKQQATKELSRNIGNHIVINIEVYHNSFDICLHIFYYEQIIFKCGQEQFHIFTGLTNMSVKNIRGRWSIILI